MSLLAVLKSIVKNACCSNVHNFLCLYPGNKTNHKSKSYSDLRILTEFSADRLNDDKTPGALCVESRAATLCRRPSVTSGRRDSGCTPWRGRYVKIL